MKKILLVDDSELLINNYATILSLDGFSEVKLAYNGKEALEKILEDKPDIVLTDLQMPEMDGYELSKKIKTDPKLSDIYIVSSSGVNLPKGMEDYIDENIPKGNIKYLLKRLKELLGGKEK